MDGALWALIHMKGIVDIKGVFFWVLHFFVVPGGYYEVALRNYEANNRAKKTNTG
jgi:hypothetical protein